jgi:hypothetical protein
VEPTGEGAEADYQAYAELPEKFMGALQTAASAISDYMADHPTYVEPLLQEFYFNALHVRAAGGKLRRPHACSTSKSAQAARAHSDSTLCIRNIVPHRT